MYLLFCLLAAHVDNFSVLSELCATLSRLAVRNEYCQDICDLGGLKFMMTLLVDSYESQVAYPNGYFSTQFLYLRNPNSLNA